MKKTMFVLGATGFVGSEVVRVALDSGWAVKALVRSQESFIKISKWGVTAVLGDAQDSALWTSELRNADVLIDLLQPEIPVPFRSGAILRVSAQRQTLTSGILNSLKNLPQGERPLYLSISGTDDLEPDRNGVISSASQITKSFSGFAHIGVPVRRLVESSGMPAVSIFSSPLSV